MKKLETLIAYASVETLMQIAQDAEHDRLLREIGRAVAAELWQRDEFRITSGDEDYSGLFIQAGPRPEPVEVTDDGGEISEDSESPVAKVNGEEIEVVQFDWSEGPLDPQTNYMLVEKNRFLELLNAHRDGGGWVPHRFRDDCR